MIAAALLSFARVGEPVALALLPVAVMHLLLGLPDGSCRLSRAVMLKGTPITALWQPLGLLALLGVAVLALAVLRFRRDLAPGSRDTGEEAAVAESVTA